MSKHKVTSSNPNQNAIKGKISELVTSIENFKDKKPKADADNVKNKRDGLINLIKTLFQSRLATSVYPKKAYVDIIEFSMSNVAIHFVKDPIKYCSLKYFPLKLYEALTEHHNEYTSLKLLQDISNYYLKPIQDNFVRITFDSKSLKQDWNDQLTSLEKILVAISSELFKKGHYNTYEVLVEPVISDLAKAFLLQPLDYVKAKYTAILICEEILYESRSFASDLTDPILARLYFHLANFHSHSEHEAWRSSVYFNALKKLQISSPELSVYIETLLIDVQKHYEPPSTGLTRFMKQYVNSISGDESEFRIDIAPHVEKNILIDKVSESGGRLDWKNIPKLSILTGANGAGKTMLLKALYKELKQKTLEQHGKDQEAEKYYSLYIKSEVTGERKVHGTTSYDFKHKYVLESFSSLINFSNGFEREKLLKKSFENFNDRVAVAILDRILSREITEIEAKTKEWITKIAEVLAFSDNLLLEPVTLVENIFKQHLDLFLDYLFGGGIDSNQALDFLFSKLPDGFDQKSDFKKSIISLFGEEWSECRKSRYEEMIIDAAVKTKLDHIAAYIDSNRDSYHIWCEEYLLAKNIASPNKILEEMTKPLFNFDIAFKWVHSHAKGNYLRLTKPDISKMERNIIYLYKNEAGIWFYRVESMEEEDSLGVDLVFDGKGELTHDQNAKVYQAISDKGTFAIGKYRLTFAKNEDLISYSSLSSGELIAVKLVLWAYLSRGIDYNSRPDKMVGAPILYNKVKVLLLDEIDKHLDPKLTRSLIEIIHEFAEKDVQVFMTTHRPDTLALVAKDPKAKIFTLKYSEENKHKVEVMGTHPLLAMLRVAGSLKEITGHHHVVYTESRGDALFYEGVYQTLMQHCDNLRKNHILADWQAVESSLNYLLSKRFQLSFTSVSTEGDGGGGCTRVIEYIASDITSYNSLKESAQKNKETLEIKLRQDPSLFYDNFLLCGSYGIVDNDYGKEHNLDRIHKAEGRKDISRVAVLDRHSIENYIFDPFVLGYLLQFKSISDKFDSNIRSTAEPQRSVKTRIRDVCTELQRTVDEFKEGESRDIQEILNDYFSLLIFDLYRKPTKEEIIEKIKKERWFFIKADKKANAAEKIALDIFEKISVDGFRANKGDYLEAMLKENELIVEGDEKQFNLLCNLIKLESNLRYEPYRLEKEEKHTRNIFIKEPKKVKIILSDGTLTDEFDYPEFFMSLRGHDIGESLLGEDSAKELSGIASEIIYNKGLKYIPIDLAIKIFDLNNNMRAHVREVLKNSNPKKSWRDKVIGTNSVALLEVPEVKKAVKQKTAKATFTLDEYGTSTYSNGMKMLKDGTKVLRDGNKILADGTSVFINGIKLSNGIRLIGSVVYPDGREIKDGIITYPDGTVIDQDGVITYPFSITAASADIQINAVFEVVFDNPLLAIPDFIPTLKRLLIDVDSINKFIALGENPEIAEQIIEAIQASSLENVVKIFFFGNLNEQKIKDTTLENIEKIEAIIGKQALSEITGYYQYVSTALSNNPLSSSANKILQIMGNLINNLEEYLDLGALYESIDIDNQVTIILTQLEHWVDFTASGHMHIGMPPRHPGFGPDFDPNGGSGGGGQGMIYSGDNGNQDPQPVMLFIGHNTTTLDL